MGSIMATIMCQTSRKDASSRRGARKPVSPCVSELVQAVPRQVEEDVPPLVRAAATGDAEAAQRCLQQGGGLVARDSRGRTPLHWAADAGDELQVGAVLALIQEAASTSDSSAAFHVDARDAVGGTALHYAAVRRGACVARQLLGAGASPLATDCHGRTPLMRAAAAGNAPLCQLLAAEDRAGELVGVRDSSCQTALHLAAGAVCGDAVRALLARGASATSVDAEGRTPLHCALQFYREFLQDAKLAQYAQRNVKVRGEELQTADAAEATVRTVEGLLSVPDAGESLRVRDCAGMTPLTRALQLRLRPAVGAMLEAGSPNFRTDVFGKTALHWAARAGDPHAVRHLVGIAFSPWKPDKQVSLCDADMTKCLLELGAKTGTRDDERRTPLYCALSRGPECREVAQLLLGAGAFTRQYGRPDSSGRSLLHAAATGGDPELVRLLLASGASVNVVDRSRQTPLSCAAELAHRDAARVLMGDPIFHLCRDDHGSTPLHWAAAHGWLREARALYALGADPTLRDDLGHSAITRAAECGHWYLAGLLFDWSTHEHDPTVFKLQ